MVKCKLVLAAAAALGGLAVSGPAQAQSGEARLFARGNFEGSAITLTGPRRGMAPITAKSLQISGGQAWELCSGSTFTGCRQFTASDSSFVMTVRSARPIAGAIPADASVAVAPGATASTLAAVTGGSLRGLASEFFVTPAQGGSRIEVEAASGALDRRAAEFCRARGWRGSAHERVQTIGGRSYLADVLCSDED